MAKKQKAQKDEPERIYCRDCENAVEFIENSCFCISKGHRVCAVNRYGKPYEECRGVYNKKK